MKILALLLNNLVILPVEDRIKFILHGESTLLILLIMELEEKVRELIKWYMDTYGVNKNQAVRDIEGVILLYFLRRLNQLDTPRRADVSEN